MFLSIMAYYVGYLLLLAAVVYISRQRAVVINDYVDAEMQNHNRHLSSQGLGMLKLLPGKVNGIEFLEGVQVGLNTLVRTGDSFSAKKDVNSTSYMYNIGYKFLFFVFGHVRFDNMDIPACFRVKKNQLQFDFTVKNGTDGCTVTLDEYNFKNFDHVTLETAVEVEPNTVQALKEALFSHVNNQLNARKMKEEYHLQAICEPQIISPEINPVQG